MAKTKIKWGAVFTLLGGVAAIVTILSAIPKRVKRQVSNVVKPRGKRGKNKSKKR